MTAPWPDRIIIGHLWFKLIGFTAAEAHKYGLETGDQGWCDYQGQRLLYLSDESVPAQADAILHEVIHAMHYGFGVTTIEGEFRKHVDAEAVTRLTATGLCMIFSANADFRRHWTAAVSPNIKTPFPQG